MKYKHPLSILVISGVLCSCAANPGPAPVEESKPSPSAESTTQKPKPGESRIAVGIDPLYQGLNPHLLADDSEFVRTLSNLVLPSAFIGGAMNADLLLNAEVVPPARGAATTIRYELNPEAQWSDGTPITVADFEYLRSGIADTPGTLDAARYRAISNIRSAGGGRTVFVDFTMPVANWQTMFSNLLPSHLLKSAADFSTALAEGIPASGWRFSLNSVDRGRGVITVNRNDRYWGAKPARVETLQFIEVRSLAQATEMLRSGQLSFIDMTPTEAARDTFELIPGTQVRTTPIDRRLQISATTQLDPAQRLALNGIADPKLIARLSTGRSELLDAPDTPSNVEVDPAPLIALGRAVRIGVDPSDPQALSAARVLADLVRKAGAQSTVVASDSTDLFGEKLSSGDLDAVVAWTSATTRDAYHCDGEVVAANLSTFCSPELQRSIEGYISGVVDEEALGSAAAIVEEQEHLNTTITRDVRLQVLGRGIVGPNPDLERWPEGLGSLSDWTINSNPAGH